MALASSWFKNDPVFQNAAANSPPLKKGDLGESVRILQQALIELGHPMPVSTQKHGTPDGDYGAETKAQVESFQKLNGLAGEADGRVGKNTLAKLDQKMVALGKPKPNFPPLSGGSAPAPISPLAKECVAVLREGTVRKVRFRYEYDWFTGWELLKVADAIEAGRITVVHKPKLEPWARYVHYNHWSDGNQLQLSFDRPEASPWFRSVVVHEAVHAYHDILGRSQRKFATEGIAHAAQAMFHMAYVGHSTTPLELFADKPATAVYEACVEEIEAMNTYPTPLPTLWGLKITPALEGVEDYRDMAASIPYDGVPQLAG